MAAGIPIPPTPREVLNIEGKLDPAEKFMIVCEYSVTKHQLRRAIEDSDLPDNFMIEEYREFPAINKRIYRLTFYGSSHYQIVSGDVVAALMDYAHLDPDSFDVYWERDLPKIAREIERLNIKVESGRLITKSGFQW